MNIKRKFESNSNKDIVLLYLIVIILSGLTIIGYNRFFNLNNSMQINTMENLTKIKRSLSDVDRIEYFNKNIKKLTLNLEEVNISQNKIMLKVNGEYSRIIELLMIISSNFTIEQFELERYEDKIFTTLYIDTSNYSIEQYQDTDILNLKNPFYTRKSHEIFVKEDFHINAILGTEILVNNEWYEKGDIIKNHKVLEIQKNEVLLRDIIDNRNIIMRVEDE